MRVDTLKKWTDFRCEVVAISRAISAALAQPTAIVIGTVGKGQSGKNGKGTQCGGKRNNQTQHACTRCGNTEHTSANCPHSDKSAENVERSEAKGSRQAEQGWQRYEFSQNVLELW